MDLSDLRREYSRTGLNREDLNADPFKQFELWFEQAKAAGLIDYSALSLATATVDGLPTVRTVLLKLFDRDGFVFFTNYKSTKALQIEENPRVSMLFHWLPLERQVIIQGTAVRVTAMESLKYFASRPRGSQLGAWVSPQSSVVSSRRLLEGKLREAIKNSLAAKFPCRSTGVVIAFSRNRLSFGKGAKIVCTIVFGTFIPAVITAGKWNALRLDGA